MIAIDRFWLLFIELSGAYHICCELTKQEMGNGEWGMGNCWLLAVGCWLLAVGC
ncbi:hypothetical protein IQ269_24190 [Tychonema sp. LEGE 07199]|uniref:hypothetical protein n=1 Tax=Tychonema sp. LEGE 07199 TaxID=1828668 RepID=UPI001880D8DD|nr:hypothetical protein [Tychonema sp. LEGE 07199]MBE9123813.1 hypothetical protein [Tychonema sp. LEGE 07199]